VVLHKNHLATDSNKGEGQGILERRKGGEGNKKRLGPGETVEKLN
jgi:hypothetical protein